MLLKSNGIKYATLNKGTNDIKGAKGTKGTKETKGTGGTKGAKVSKGQKEAKALNTKQSCQGLWICRALLHLGVGWRLTMPGAFIYRTYEGACHKGALLRMAYGGAHHMGTLLRLVYAGALGVWRRLGRWAGRPWQDSKGTKGLKKPKAIKS